MIHISDLIYQWPKNSCIKEVIFIILLAFQEVKDNGFKKGDKRVLKLIRTTENAVNNETPLRNTIYNLTKLSNLKDRILNISTALNV